MHLRCNESAAQTQRPCKALHYQCNTLLSFVKLLSMQQQLSFYSRIGVLTRVAPTTLSAHEFFQRCPWPSRALLFFTVLCSKVHQRKAEEKSGSNLWWPSIGAVDKEWHNFSRILTLKHTYLLCSLRICNLPSTYLDLNWLSQCLKITQKVAFIIFQFWHFPPIFVLFKVICLVTLFNLNFWFLAFFMNFCPLTKSHLNFGIFRLFLSFYKLPVW